MMDEDAEKWKPIPGYEGFYSASSLGRIRTDDHTVIRSNGVPCHVSAKIRKQRLNAQRGYMQCDLKRPESRFHTFNVHNLIMLAFVGPKPNGCDVCHLNGDRADNRLLNLRYDSRAANMADKWMHGTQPFGERHAMSVLTEDDVREMRRLNSSRQYTQSEIGRMFGVRRETVNGVVNYREWDWAV